uniref:Uncharacterized protein n=1 Tax=Candidatus Kentrum sp. TUN TaxID=2126343 RepID=A0A450ZY26_9GAMM|nr:MAG: hypothetical protein BECKTUN1418D_GA0071000_108715 [Candidatus Kentron sp. TUN]
MIGLIIRILRGFAIVWIWLIGLFWTGNIVFMWYYEGFSRVQELLNPFNIIYYSVVVITFLPDIGANMLADRFDRRDKKYDK